MLEFFRQLVLILALTAPGQVGCDKPIPAANVCWVTFQNPSYVEYIRPGDIRRIYTLIEIKRAEGK